MKVVVQDDETKLYVAPQGSWTEKAEDARDFTMSIRARTVARDLKLKSFRVLFFFPDLDYQIVVCDS